MKKLFILGAVLATLSMGACSRRSNCPAYGSIHKAAATPSVRA